MEAIQPGSSTVVRSPNAYETVSPFTKDDRNSYTSQELQPPESEVIYNEPDITGTTESHGALAQV